MYQEHKCGSSCNVLPCALVQHLDESCPSSDTEQHQMLPGKNKNFKLEINERQ